MDNELYSCKNIVYAIKNKINNKQYIGKTINSFYERYHRGLEKHHNPHLRRAIKKYGIENFEIILLAKNVDNLELLSNLEIKYIKEYKSFDPEYGYNKTYGGEGVHHTDETKAKTSKALKGKPKSEEHKAKLRKPKSEEYKKKMSDIKKKYYLSIGKSHVNNSKLINNSNFKPLCGPNNGMYGKKHSEETKKYYSETRKGNKNPMYGKNIKDYMSPEAYEEWKLHVARKGRMNGRAKETVIVYKHEEFIFDYFRQAIKYFKEMKGEPMTVNWLYRGINPKYADKFQFVGYKENYEEYLKALS